MNGVNYEWGQESFQRQAAVPQEAARLRRQIEATDRQIDQLVHAPHGLTDAEIKIVGEATRG